MRKLLGLLLFLSCVQPLQAQIVGITLEEKTAKKHKDLLVTRGSKLMLIGEPRSGFQYDGATLSWSRIGPYELWLLNPDDPTALPYRIKGEEKVPAGGKAFHKGKHEDSAATEIIDSHQSLHGLAEEYKKRLATIGAGIEERDRCAKGSQEWMAAHQRLMSHYERLHSWLLGMGFTGAAKKLDKDMVRQRKAVAAALRARVDAAKDAIAQKPTPEDLVEAARKITGGRDKFKVMESLHVRIIYLEQIGDERVRALLELAEDAIDGFRGDCIDPHLPEIDDKIPDELISEFWFGPEDVNAYERFWTDYYGFSWGSHKEESLKMDGTEGYRPFAPRRVHYWKTDDRSDLEGMVTHGLGHDLADLQHHEGRQGSALSWIREGLGLYLSLEFLGRNNVNCKAFSPDPTYVRDRLKEGKIFEGMGLREMLIRIALDQGPNMMLLSVRKLSEFEAPDIAKSWSFYDYLVREEGKNGQLLLRAACASPRDRAAFPAKWRELAGAIYGGEEDAIDALERRWRAATEAGGGADAGPRSR